MPYQLDRRRASGRVFGTAIENGRVSAPPYRHELSIRQQDARWTPARSPSPGSDHMGGLLVQRHRGAGCGDVETGQMPSHLRRQL